ncbi:uncharacterized protein LOC133832698 [Humulus lupulus]|uniref:uncharacterized protein LOC133832698 n=1 Tax=Humulus lupulus TaxID=3486 RepID=UPI002B417E58|nr:uncharacterized protein LOC133832698 [Humulus lupulus]
MENDMSEALAQLNILNKLPQQLTKEDIINKHLPTVDHWEDIYYKYSHSMGFSVRKEDARRDNENKEWQRKWVCSNKGFRREKWTNLKNRKKKPRVVTCTGCLALLRMKFDKSENSWVVKDFNPTHDHNFALKTDMQFLRSNRAFPDCMGTQVMSMRRSGIWTFHILNHLAAERGGHEYVPSLKKDLYNWIG